MSKTCKLAVEAPDLFLPLEDKREDEAVRGERIEELLVPRGGRPLSVEGIANSGKASGKRDVLPVDVLVPEDVESRDGSSSLECLTLLECDLAIAC
jgi:hypothetical protein